MLHLILRWDDGNEKRNNPGNDFPCNLFYRLFIPVKRVIFKDLVSDDYGI